MVIDLSEKAETAETIHYTPPTSEEKLRDLIRSWISEHLERKMGWGEGEIEVLDAGWLEGAGESWAFCKVKLGEQQPSRSYICRSLYDAAYARIETATGEAVQAILKVYEGEEAVIEYSKHYRTEIEFSKEGTVLYFEEGKEVSPSYSMQAYAQRVVSCARKLAAILGNTPKGNLSAMGGREIVAKILWEAESALSWTKAW